MASQSILLRRTQIWESFLLPLPHSPNLIYCQSFSILLSKYLLGLSASHHPSCCDLLCVLLLSSVTTVLFLGSAVWPDDLFGVHVWLGHVPFLLGAFLGHLKWRFLNLTMIERLLRTGPLLTCLLALFIPYVTLCSCCFSHICSLSAMPYNLVLSYFPQIF